MEILLLLAIASLFLFLKDSYESTEDLIGIRWAIFILTAIAIVLTVIVGKYAVIFSKVFTHWN